MSKTIIRVPLKDAFAFVEMEVEGVNDVNATKLMYDNIKRAFNEESNPTDFYQYLIKVINADLSDEWGDVDTYQARPQIEKDVIQALKRFKKRLPIIE